MRLTPEQAKARPAVRFGRADDDLYMFSNDHGGILTPALDISKPQPL